jgi:RepB DNA-primase from phage plasmid
MVERANACVPDRGLFLSLHAIRRQLAAMPYDLYLVRLIHQVTRRAFPGERLWTATQLIKEPTVRFLRLRNREGCDIYIQPYAGDHNAGYILLDLDHGNPDALEHMRANGHEPCVALQTSPGRLQAWIRVSARPLELTVASTISRELARAYGGDLASTDGRHLGRLAGFTNQKPSRRQRSGYAPWVRLVYAQIGWATQGTALVAAAMREGTAAPGPLAATGRSTALRAMELVISAHHPEQAHQIYQGWLHRLHIPQRFPNTDWSIADKWIAKSLLQRGTSLTVVAALLRGGSPGFPRGHADPEDYLRRTLARALRELHGEAFPASCAPCVRDAAQP